MIIEISEYYKNKGYIRAYLATNKEPRRVCMLRKADGTTKSISYAKYLYTSYYGYEIAVGDHVDHINGNKLDDRIETAKNVKKLKEFHDFGVLGKIENDEVLLGNEKVMREQSVMLKGNTENKIFLSINNQVQAVFKIG